MGAIATGQRYNEILHMAKQYRYRKGGSLATCTWVFVFESQNETDERCCRMLETEAL